MPAFNVRVPLLLCAALALIAGVAGGLARLGFMPTVSVPATALHGALMINGFLGTVIGLERAVALGQRYAYLAPLAAALGTAAMLLGFYPAGAILWLFAPLALFAASVAIVWRQPAAHTVLLAVASMAWAVGNVAYLGGAEAAAPTWWYSFLVLTIAAERLELTRLMPRHPWAMQLFMALVAGILAAAVTTLASPALGYKFFGLALLGFAGWLAAFDIVRRTVRTQGFARYAAVALIGGYAWLAVGGAAWAFAPAQRDLALHALGLGFVFSMILAHAPIIVPAIARVRMRFVSAFYAPLALLHISLLVRFASGGFEAAAWRSVGGALNAVAIVVFAGTLAYALKERREQ